MVERAIIAARRKIGHLRRRLGGLVCEFVQRRAAVREEERAVVDITIGVALVREQRRHFARAPRRPMVRRHRDLGLAAPFQQHRVDHLRPAERIAHLRTAQGQDIVEIVGHDFGRVQRLIGGDVEGELRRRLGAARVEEFEGQTVDRQRAALFADRLGRFHIADRPRRQLRAQPRVDLARRAGCEGRAEHIERAPSHRAARKDILRRRFLRKAVRRDDADILRLDAFGRHDPADTAEMVAMTVRKNHRLDRPLARFGFDRIGEQLPSGCRRFFGQERVDDDPAGLAADDRHHRNIVAADLPDLVRHHFEQSVHGVEPRLPPERRIDRIGRLPGIEEDIGPPVPHGPAVGGLDQPVRNLGDLAARRVGRVARIIERQTLCQLSLRGAGRFARRVLCGNGKGQARDKQQGGPSAHRLSPPYFGAACAAPFGLASIAA